MKRKLKKILALILMLTISVNAVLPAGASTTPGDYDALISELGRTFDLFKELGFDYDSLTKIIDVGTRGEDFWGAPATSHVMTEEDLQELKSANITMHNEHTIANKLSTATADAPIPDMKFDIQPRDGDPYDGNPPHTEEEQAERMKYIWGVYNKYYSAPKYNPDTYLVYLYMSHYTENMNYDRTAAKPNFDSIYAHIISNNDIVAYDNFLRISQYSRVLARIADFGTVLDVLSGIQGGVGLYTKEISEANDILEAQVNIVKGALALIPGDEEVKEQQLSEVADGFSENFKEAKNAEQLISKLNAQLNESGGLGDFVNVFAGSVQGIFTNAAFMTIGSGIMGGIFGACELMKSFMSIGNLASLYYGWSTRYADRMGIYYGLFPWP